jgi:TM2 domain-containing membrane protein YozV
MGLPVPPEAVSPKSRLAATLLAYFVGTLGVHRFYVGKIGTGVAIVVLLVIGSILYGIGFAAALGDALSGWYGNDIFITEPVWSGAIALFIVGAIMMGAAGIWAFVDFLIIVTGHMKDGRGRLIRKWNS